MSTVGQHDGSRTQARGAAAIYDTSISPPAPTITKTVDEKGGELRI